MKKLLSLALVLAMVLTMATTAFATEITGNSGSTDITYTADESYTVTIPDSMSIGTDATVSVSNVTLAAGKQLTVSVSSTQYDNGWKLKNGDNALGYTLKINDTDVASGDTILTAKTGETASATLATALTGTATYAGTYKDTLTFSVDVKDSSEIVTGLNATETEYHFTTESTINWSEIKFTVTYADGHTETIPYNHEELTLTELGYEFGRGSVTSQYTASFGGQTCSFSISSGLGG